MLATYDLHIHSALSPCAEPEMTPNNIVNMAVIKELDFIAICDHNAIANVAAAIEVVERDQLPLVVVPGIEVQSKEDVHVLCLFPTYLLLKAFYDEINPFIQQIPHNAKRFGSQQIMDANDDLVGEFEWSLYASIQLSIDDIIHKAIALGGGAIPAHLDRNSYSMIANLGFINADLPISAVEFSPDCDPDTFTKRHLYLRRYTMLTNSDAHELIQMSEPVHTLEVPHKTIEGLFAALFAK